MRRWMTGACVALGLTIFGAAGVAAECAAYISSGGPEGGSSGELLGEQRVTASLSAGADYAWANLDGSYTVSYSVGFYKMNDGSIIAVDCRTYTQVR